MGRRLHTDNPIWVGCCCGCLPILALIQSAILIPCMTIPIVVWNTVVATILLFCRDLWYSYYVLAVTGRLGWKIKLLGMLLLGPCIITWPAWVCLISLIIAPFAAIETAFEGTMFDDEGNEFTQAFITGAKRTYDEMKEFADFSYNSAFDYLFKMRNYSGEPFDISFTMLFASLGLSVLGILFCTPVITVLAVIKFLPFLCWMWIELTKWWQKQFKVNCCWGVMVTLFWVIGMVLSPVGAVIVFGLCSIGGLIFGSWVAVPTYQEGIRAGLIKIWTTVVSFDECSNEVIFDEMETSCSLLRQCCLKLRVPQEPVPEVSIPVQTQEVVVTFHPEPSAPLE